MKIRSGVPENGCLIVVADGKNAVKHIRIRLIGGCVKKGNYFNADSEKCWKLFQLCAAITQLYYGKLKPITVTVKSAQIPGRLNKNKHQNTCMSNSNSEMNTFTKHVNTYTTIFPGSPSLASLTKSQIWGNCLSRPDTVKPEILFRMPFISLISPPRQIHENNRSQILTNSLVYCITSSSASKIAKIKGTKIIW